MIAILTAAALFGQIPGNVLVYPADAPRRQHPNREPVRVSFVGAKAAELETGNGKQECLQITIKVENLDPKRSITYLSWSKDFQQRPAYAKTASGLTLKNPKAVVEGQKGEEIIRPRKALTDVLLFEMPPFKEPEIVITFPNDHFKFPDQYAAVETFTWVIQRKEWMKSAAALAPVVDVGSKEPVVSAVGSVKATVVEVVIKPAVVEEATETNTTKADLLHVRLQIENTTETIPAEFNGWAGAVAQTNDGKKLKQVSFGIGQRIAGEYRGITIKPKTTVETVLVFEPPSRNAKSIEIKLNPHGAFIQGSDPTVDTEWFAFTVPNAFWNDYFRKDDEARNKAVEKMKPAKKGKT